MDRPHACQGRGRDLATSPPSSLDCSIPYPLYPIASLCCAPLNSLLWPTLGQYLVLNLLTAVIFAAFSSARQHVGQNDGHAIATSPRSSPSSPQAWRPESGEAKVEDEVEDEEAARKEALEWPEWLPGRGMLDSFIKGERRGFALGRFSINHPLRRTAISLLGSHLPWLSIVSFENGIIACIVLSSLLMTLDDCTLESGSALFNLLERANVIVTLIFAAELLVRIVACGLVAAPATSQSGVKLQPYLHSWWNILDAFIVGASLASSATPLFRALRVLRVLRPLRLIPRLAGLKLVVELFLRAMPKMVSDDRRYSASALLYLLGALLLTAGRFDPANRWTS